MSQIICARRSWHRLRGLDNTIWGTNLHQVDRESSHSAGVGREERDVRGWEEGDVMEGNGLNEVGPGYVR